MAVANAKRKQWSQESMYAAVKAVNEGNGLRETARLFNLPVESLRRRIIGAVPIDCKPGPDPVLSKDEESELVAYCLKMAEMGFGSRDDVMRMGFLIAEKVGHKHPFKEDQQGELGLTVS